MQDYSREGNSSPGGQVCMQDYSREGNSSPGGSVCMQDYSREGNSSPGGQVCMQDYSREGNSSPGGQVCTLQDIQQGGYTPVLEGRCVPCRIYSREGTLQSWRAGVYPAGYIAGRVHSSPGGLNVYPAGYTAGRVHTSPGGQVCTLQDYKQGGYTPVLEGRCVPCRIYSR